MKALLAKEKRHRRQIMFRVSGVTDKRTRLMVTISALHKWCPEFFASKVDTLAKDFRGYLSLLTTQLDEKIAEEVSKEIDPQLMVLQDLVRKCLKRVQNIETKLGIVDKSNDQAKPR